MNKLTAPTEYITVSETSFGRTKLGPKTNAKFFSFILFRSLRSLTCKIIFKVKVSYFFIACWPSVCLLEIFWGWIFLTQITILYGTPKILVRFFYKFSFSQILDFQSIGLCKYIISSIGENLIKLFVLQKELGITLIRLFLRSHKMGISLIHLT